MGLFSRHNTGIRYGALVDIGSGSVLSAIIKSDSSLSYPEIIWAKREYVPIRRTVSIQESAKHVMTSLMNALMLLDGEGRRVYQTVAGTQRLPDVQVTIAAPWSYTVTKDIAYNHANEFTLSSEIVEELLRTAETKVEEELREQERINQLGLTVVTRSVIGLVANGYTIEAADNQKITSLKVVQASAVAQDYLVKALDEAFEKLAPEATVKLYSFMLVFYTIVQQLETLSAEYCLVDITYEATELGVIRNGLLQYTTHTPFGSYSLARELAEIFSVPLEEAFGYLHHRDPLEYIRQAPADRLTEAKDLFAAYENKLTELFHETGDTLSIPKKIYIHGNLRTEPFFLARVSDAAKRATNSSHAVYPTSIELLNRFYPEDLRDAMRESALDTALLLSAQFFHTKDFRDRFAQR